MSERTGSLEPKKAEHKGPPPKINETDECGVDDNEDYPYGYAPKGKRLHAMKPGSRKCRLNIIDAWRNGKLIAPWFLKGVEFYIISDLTLLSPTH